MKKKSLKTITLTNLITFLLGLTIIILVILTWEFRQISIKIVEDKALALSDVVKAGITAHMKSKTMAKREYFLKEINSLPMVNDVKIIRSFEVITQFGSGIHLEKTMDDITKEAFESKVPVFIIDDLRIDPYMRAIVPFVASQKGNLNCLRCHNVSEGTVLGAVDFKLDLTEYRNVTIRLLVIIAFITAIFIFLIIANNFRTVQKYVHEPLESLMKGGEDAYYNNKPINENEFECLEFEHMAKEINLFTADIIKRKKVIEEKNIELEELNLEIEDSHKETIFTMGLIEEHRSKETKNHTMRVTKYCNLLGVKCGLSENEIDLLITAAPLHDIGKLGIPDSILLKPGQLSENEYEIMKSHSAIGHKMLKHSKRNILHAASIIAHQHHERWDGAGYPQKLKGNNIHVFGRIVALADVFDALLTERVYKKEWSMKDTIYFISNESGKQFDPDLVKIFEENISTFMEIKDKYQ